MNKLNLRYIIWTTKLYLDHYGRKQRAVQRAFDIGDEALAAVTKNLYCLFKQEPEWA